MTPNAEYEATFRVRVTLTPEGESFRRAGPFDPVGMGNDLAVILNDELGSLGQATVEYLPPNGSSGTP